MVDDDEEVSHGGVFFELWQDQDDASLLQTVFRDLLVKYKLSPLEQHHEFISKILAHVQMDVEQKSRLQQVLQHDSFEIHSEYLSRFRKGDFKPAPEDSGEAPEVTAVIDLMESSPAKVDQDREAAAVVRAHSWTGARKRGLASTLLEFGLVDANMSRTLEQGCGIVGSEAGAVEKIKERCPGSMRDKPVYAKQAIDLFD
jgi:hypothetical protein